jgi:beta-glucosidase
MLRLKKDYGDITIVITENGTSLPDVVGPDGQVHDAPRTRYLAQNIGALYDAIQAGVKVAGYFVWSFMDNYEWGFGFTKQFGIVHVDYPTQTRTIKDSGHWYSETVRRNGFPISAANHYSL